MKLETIINLYSVKNRVEQPLILKVLSSIVDFGRKISLRLSYKEIKEIYENYEEERKDLVKKYINKYCEEENTAHKNEPNWVVLIPSEVNSIPPKYMNKFNDEIREIQQSDISLKQPMKFTMKEVRTSGIDIAEMDLLEEFVDWNSDPYDEIKKNTDKPKKK